MGFGLALALAASGFAVPQLPFAALVALPTLLAIGFGVLAMTQLRPGLPPLPAMAAGDAVQLVSFRGHHSVLHCVNPDWGHAFARANRAPVVPKRRSARFGRATVVIGALVTPAAALAVFIVAHPSVCIDNAGDTALQIWVDGVAERIVAAHPDQASPIHLFVPYGKHTYGYSRVGGTKPEATVEADTSMLHDHLYNPGTTSCYRLVVDRYGSASTAGMASGPLTVQELYTFDKIDTWFRDNPATVRSSSGCESGATQTALQRMAECPGSRSARGR